MNNSYMIFISEKFVVVIVIISCICRNYIFEMLVCFVPCKVLTTWVLLVSQEQKEREERPASPAQRLVSPERWDSRVSLEIQVAQNSKPHILKLEFCALFI